MGEKTAGVGHFTIPTAPAAGTSCTSGAANVFTGTYVVLSASAPSTLFITGIHLESSAALAATYIVVQLATGGAGSETVVGQYLVPLSTASTVALGYRAIYPFIAIPSGTRIACKTADSVGAKATLVTLECIAQSNVVDDGVVVGTVTTVTNQLTGAAIATAVWQDATAGDFTTASSIGKALYVANVVPGAAGGHFIAGTNAATTITTGLTTTFTGNLTGSVASVTGAVGSVTGAVGSVTGLTASNLDTTISSRMASYTQPTGFLAATFPATVASTTNITAGTITTVTNLTNAPTAGDLTATMKTSVTTAATAATPTAAAVTGAVGSVTAAVTVGTINANVVNASALAADAVTEIQSGLSTYAGGDTAGTTTLLSRLSAGRALLLDNLDATITSRFAAASYTAPDNASITAIKAKTDGLTFTVAGFIDANCLKIKGITVAGAGTSGDPWRPA